MQTSPATAQALDTFTVHYIAAALQLCGEEIGTDATIENLAPEALDKMVADCATFQADNAATLEAAWKYADEENTNAAGNQFLGQGSTEYFDGQAGTDFWLNRNGHGAGYWDRAEIYGEAQATALDKAATAFNEADLYLGDNGLVYHSPA